MTQQQTRSNDTTRQEEPDDTPYEAALEHPPFLKFGIGFLEFVAGIATNVIQVSTSTYAFLSGMEGETVRVKNIQELLTIQPHMFTIALVISIGVQLVLHMNSQSMSSTWRRLRHIRLSHDTLHAATDVKNYLEVRTWLFVVALLLDVIGDSRYVTLFTKEPVAVGAWVIFLTALSTLVMYDGATRMWGAMQDWKDYKLYHLHHYQ